jgi:hypothetical protein
VKQFQPIPEATEIVATAVIDAAFKVHKTLGPGLLETAYETCLAHELRLRCRSCTTTSEWTGACGSTCSWTTA